MEAILENLMIGESIQRGIRSGTNMYMIYARYEKALDLFHNTVDRILDGREPIQE